MERQTIWLCIGVGLLLLGAVLAVIFLTRDNSLSGSGITFVKGLTQRYGYR